MCFSPINEGNRQAFVDNYIKWQCRFYNIQMIPVIGMIGDAGVLCLDLKTLIANKLSTENAILEQQIAKATYSRPGAPKNEPEEKTSSSIFSLINTSELEKQSSSSIRAWSVINFLTANCLPMIVLVLGLIFTGIAAGCGLLCCTLCC